jgi:TetR/AcrR family transcriptional regulator, cholesterol catabolism regulator
MLTNHSINKRPLQVRRAQAAWRRDQLLDAAGAVFAQAGIDGASMKDVAQAAGVTPGLLYHYFGSKEELVTAVLDRHGFLPELQRLFAAPAEQPVAEILEALVSRFAVYLADQPDRMRLYFAGYAHPQVRAALTVAIAQGERLLTEFLASRVASGELRPHDSTVAVQMLLSTVALGQLTGSAINPRGLVDTLLYGLAARREGSP